MLPFGVPERPGSGEPKRWRVVAYWAFVGCAVVFGSALLPTDGLLGWVVVGCCLVGLGVLIYFRQVRPWWRERAASSPGATAAKWFEVSAGDEGSHPTVVGSTLLVVTRPRGGMGAMRKVKIYLDDENVGRLATRRELRLRVPAGVHTIAARIDYMRGHPVPVDLSKPPEVVTVEVSTSMLNAPLPICKVVSEGSPNPAIGAIVTGAEVPFCVPWTPLNLHRHLT